MFGFRCLAFGGFQLLRLKIFGGFWGCGVTEFQGSVVVDGGGGGRSFCKWWVVGVGDGCGG